ncbi:MAG: NADP-dependent malic enzyme [Saprospiraceae bacterium]|nr:MAG: malate dehydrogenase [Candidatus Parvibacillus calidus]MBX2936163.1 NADP-dependent malic enzyme [Saprospiraceae bacterium]MBX7179110.1 NADP-dependent malic enzyme [Saprospiraceae bacterium]MCB0589885.1 NADP-dependent malic enzyme [Saprospiraceae bacterium]MCC7148602.1 NADP-dependent malic enzyme [Saprospiraceae bacterium]
MDYFKEALFLHKQLKGKISVQTKFTIKNRDDLSLVYSPGVAAPCLEIAEKPETVYDYTLKGNTVAIVSDGSAVLGLGNIGAAAAIPVMEGKAMLFKRFANINAFPICLDTQNTQEIIDTVKRIAPVFGGINLEDISAPRCLEIENALQDLGIPVFHDDQHGTAVVTLAGLINASKLLDKPLSEMRVVINGAGAAGIAIARLLRCVEHTDNSVCQPVKEIIICDTKGIIHRSRTDLTDVKKSLLAFSNSENMQGTVKDAIRNADVFIGVSSASLLDRHDIATMNKDSIIFALANPIPEIMPDEAYAGGAAIVGTGRSDFPNQVNNVLGFPGIFRGALDVRAPRISPSMKMAAAYAIADCIDQPTKENIIPATLNDQVAYKVAEAVRKAAMKEWNLKQIYGF